MANICPECGGILKENKSCQDIFDSFLVQEFSDPAYGEVHMLTVACFFIQHERYSDEALTWIEGKLHQYLYEGISPDIIRQRVGKEAQQQNRTWKVTRQPSSPPLPKISWTMTIADVFKKYQDAESYCKLIREWATKTLHEMKPLLP